MDSTRIPPDELVAHAGFVRSLAFHLLRNDADADDATQETLARAIERPPKREGQVRPWLSGVLRNVVRRGARDSGRRERREAQVATLEPSPSTEDFAAREQILRTVGAAVLALDEPQRVVVLLRHYEGLPPRVIATRLGIPVETVKSRLKRAHEGLREALDEGRMGNVEGWRSSLALLVGFDPGHGAGPTGTTSAGAITAGGAIMTSKAVGIVAVALIAACAGFGIVWTASAPPNEKKSDAGPVAESLDGPNRAGTGPASGDRPPDLSASPRVVTNAHPKATPEAGAKPAESPADGPAAGWRRWTVGAIQIDVPESWKSDESPMATDMRSWLTSERPWPVATIQLHRAGPESLEKLLADAIISPSEQIQIARRGATLRVVEPKRGPPGLNLKGLVVTLDSPPVDNRPLSFFAVSIEDKFIEFEPTYRRILASVRIVDSSVARGNEFPSIATLAAYEGETAADVLEGVVLLGDAPLPGGEVRMELSPSSTRTAAIGPDGRFRIDQLVQGAVTSLDLTPAAGTPRRVHVPPTPTGAHRRVIVVMGRASVEGRVFDRNGRPVVGATVNIGRQEKAPDAWTWSVALTKTDREGAYRADHLVPGRHQVLVTIGNGPIRTSLVEITGTTTARCDVGSATPDPTLSGVVRRASGVVPGPGSLMFSSTDGKSMETTSYDADGRYSVQLTAGTYHIRVQPPQPHRSVLIDDPVIVGAGAASLDLSLPGGTIRGRVINPATRLAHVRDGSDKKPWRIELLRLGVKVIDMNLTANVADDGTFRVDFLAPGRYEVTGTLSLAPGPDGNPRVIEVLDGGVETVVDLELREK